MGKSVIKVDEDLLPKFLMALPEGVCVVGAVPDDDYRDRFVLSVEGHGVPEAEEVEAFIHTAEVAGEGVRKWMSLEAAG